MILPFRNSGIFWRKFVCRYLTHRWEFKFYEHHLNRTATQHYYCSRCKSWGRE